MKTISKIDIKKGIVYFNDDSIKLIDNYILELEDRLLKVSDIVRNYLPNEQALVDAIDEIDTIVNK